MEKIFNKVILRQLLFKAKKPTNQRKAKERRGGGG